MADIVENDEGSIDAANSVVANPGRHLVRGLSCVAHRGRQVWGIALEANVDEKLERVPEQQ